MKITRRSREDYKEISINPEGHWATGVSVIMNLGLEGWDAPYVSWASYTPDNLDGAIAFRDAVSVAIREARKLERLREKLNGS